MLLRELGRGQLTIVHPACPRAAGESAPSCELGFDQMYRGGAARGRPLSDVRALTRGGSVAHWCNGGSLGRSPHCHVTSGTRSCVRLQLKRPVDRRAGHCTQPSVVLNSSSSSRESVRRVIECVFVQLSRMWGFVQRFVGHRGFYRFDSTIHLRPQATNDNECGGVRSQRTSADTQCILRMHAHTTRNTQLTCSHVQLGFKAQRRSWRHLPSAAPSR